MNKRLPRIPIVHNNPAWNCRKWVVDVVQELKLEQQEGQEEGRKDVLVRIDNGFSERSLKKRLKIQRDLYEEAEDHFFERFFEQREVMSVCSRSLRRYRSMKTNRSGVHIRIVHRMRLTSTTKIREYFHPPSHASTAKLYACVDHRLEIPRVSSTFNGSCYNSPVDVVGNRWLFDPSSIELRPIASARFTYDSIQRTLQRTIMYHDK